MGEQELQALKLPERLKWVGVSCIAVGGLGFAIIVLGLITIWKTDWGIALFAPGATLITVALTAYVAARGVVSWREQRERDREAAEYRHREQVYEDIATYMLFRFIGQDTNIVLDGKLRAAAALWGSADTVAALRDWQSSMSRILKDHGVSGGVTVTMTDAESATMKDAYGAALEAMRSDLGSSTGKEKLSKDVLLASIFNDGDR